MKKMDNNDFKLFSDSEIDKLLNNPRDLRNDPYMVLTAYLLDNIRTLVTLDDNTDMWNSRVPSKVFNSYIKECLDDFHNTASNGDPIRINMECYSIRRYDSIDWSNSDKILCFPIDGDDVIIAKTGIRNIGKSNEASYETRKKESLEDRRTFWKIAKLASTDDGWDLLTDAEVAAYLWAVKMRKVSMSAFITEDMIKKWWEENYDFFNIPLKEVMSWIKYTDGKQLNTLIPFSYKKIDEWNAKNKQLSSVQTVTDKEADEYRYLSAYKKFSRK